jgi:hypothetical protein
MSHYSPGHVLGVTTLKVYEYASTVLAPRQQYFEFSAAACSDVHVALAEDARDIDGGSAYEVVIGGWDNTR